MKWWQMAGFLPAYLLWVQTPSLIATGVAMSERVRIHAASATARIIAVLIALSVPLGAVSLNSRGQVALGIGDGVSGTLPDSSFPDIADQFSGHTEPGCHARLAGSALKRLDLPSLFNRQLVRFAYYDWTHERFSQRHAAAQSRLENVRVDVVQACQLRQRQGLTIPVEQSVVSFVAPLLNRSRPADVPKLVRPIVIDAVDRVFLRWAWADVPHERFKVDLPFSTDRDAPTAVSGIRMVVRIEASLLHRSPLPVLVRSRAAVRLQSLGGLLSRQTSATLSLAGSQSAAVYHGFLTADATAAPERTLRARDHSKSAEYFA